MAKISIFFYFVACLFGRQYLYPRDTISPTVKFDAMNYTHTATFAVTGPYAYHSPYMYVPVFTIFEYICFVGWIKVADELVNPFGDDDYDFRINYLIDRNFQVSYMIVDEGMPELELLNDPFLDKTLDKTERPRGARGARDPLGKNHFFVPDDIPPAELPYRNNEHSGCLNNIKGMKDALSTYIYHFT